MSNTESIILHLNEIQEITGRVKPHAQIKALDALKIPFSQRHDGSIVVARDAARIALGAIPPNASESNIKLHIDKL